MNNTTFYLLFCNVCIAIRLLNRTDDFMLMCYTNIYMSTRRIHGRITRRLRRRRGNTTDASAVESFIECSQRICFMQTRFINTRNIVYKSTKWYHISHLTSHFSFVKCWCLARLFACMLAACYHHYIQYSFILSSEWSFEIMKRILWAICFIFVEEGDWKEMCFLVLFVNDPDA